MISKAKLSKKTKKERDNRDRNVWNMSPITRVVESKKVYKRSKVKKVGVDTD